MRPIRVYEIYGCPGISASAHVVDILSMAVGAHSIKQAYYFAHNEIWASGIKAILGILLFFDGSAKPNTLLWCGCKLNDSSYFRHGAGKREILSEMLNHLQECEKAS